MMFTSPMTQLFAVVLSKDRERVTESLLRAGVMQFLQTTELDLGTRDSSLSTLASRDSLSDMADLRRRVEGFLHTIGIVPATPRETDLNPQVEVNLDEEKRRLDEIDGQRESLRERQRALQQEINKLEDLLRQVTLYGIGLEGVTLPNQQSILSVQTGKLPVEQDPQLADALKGLPAMSVALGTEGDVSHHLLISMKRDRDRIESLLRDLQWTEVELPAEILTVHKDLAAELRAKIKTLSEEQKKLQTQVVGLIEKQANRLQLLWVRLRVRELCLRIQGNFQSSSRTVLFVGWLPTGKKQNLEKAIQQASGNRCYTEWVEAGDKGMIGHDIPVQFNNPPWLAPFQMLVSNFGVPQYGTIDPTPFVMPLYLALFGLMFADAGQGLVLMLLGWLGMSHFKHKSSQKGLRCLACLIIWCGASSVLFGVLFGSYFGVAWIKPVWFDFHGVVVGHTVAEAVITEVSDILKITLYLGITVISLGLLFNWVNLVRTKKWMDLVFDKGGVLGGWMYAGGIYTATYMVTHEYKTLPAGGVLFLLLGLPGLLLMLKEPLHYWQHRHDAEEPVRIPMLAMNILMEWIVELLEIFSGYLSNTLSFLRVAGLGIAHVCLMISFFTMAGMTDSVLMKVLILILGNVLVIGLEGLSAGIQALRLNYYEFFTKFFHGTGKLHTPIALNSDA